MRFSLTQIANGAGQRLLIVIVLALLTATAQLSSRSIPKLEIEGGAKFEYSSLNWSADSVRLKPMALVIQRYYPKFDPSELTARFVYIWGATLTAPNHDDSLTVLAYIDAQPSDTTLRAYWESPAFGVGTVLSSKGSIREASSLPSGPGSELKATKERIAIGTYYAGWIYEMVVPRNVICQPKDFVDSTSWRLLLEMIMEDCQPEQSDTAKVVK